MKTVHFQSRKKRGISGFTLIELMVAIAVVAILAAVALPSYVDYVKRGKIAEATGKLTVLRSELEQYYQDNHTYVGACASGTVAPLPADDDFHYTCPTLSATSFTAQADGVSGGSMAGFTYTIDQDDTKKTVATSWGTTSSSCWISKKGETC